MQDGLPKAGAIADTSIVVINQEQQVLYASPGIFNIVPVESIQQAVISQAKTIVDNNNCRLSVSIEQGELDGQPVAVVKLTRGAVDCQKQLTLLRNTLDVVPEGIIITDTRGEIIYYNEALEDMEGLKGSEVTGKHLTEVYQVTPETSEHMAVVQTGEPVKELPKLFFTTGGREVNLMASTYPVFEQGRVIGAFSICRDVTRIKDLLSRNILLQKQMQSKNRDNANNNGTRYTFSNLIYASEVMDSIVRQAEKAAKTDCAILVYGETGTGKEVLVQSIHNASARQLEPFVGINCAAIPDTLLESTLFGTVKGAFTGAINSSGLFEQAGEGTLFLDEINSMSPQLQAKLLRVLQERTYRRLGDNKELPVNCRIFTSTNLDPWDCIKKGTLREDLYYRFAVFTVFIPPLRERPADIETLSSYFMQRYGNLYGQGQVELAEALKDAFLRYQWPGNVRELEHVIESCLAMLDPGETVVSYDHLPVYVRPKFMQSKKLPALTAGSLPNSLHKILLDTERQVIENVLENNNGNITRSAKELGLLRQNLQYRMRRLGIRPGPNK